MIFQKKPADEVSKIFSHLLTSIKLNPTVQALYERAKVSARTDKLPEAWNDLHSASMLTLCGSFQRKITYETFLF